MPSPLKKGSPDGSSTKDKSPLLRESTKSPRGQEDKGQDNPVFDMDREEMQSRLGDISSVSGVGRRRGSAVLTLPSSSLLSVPKPGTIHEFFYSSSFSANSWQSPARIDILWSQPIVRQYWRDSARNWQKMTNYRKTRMSRLSPQHLFLLRH